MSTYLVHYTFLRILQNTHIISRLLVPDTHLACTGLAVARTMRLQALVQYWQPSRLVAPFYTSRSVPKHGNACMAYSCSVSRLSPSSPSLALPCLALPCLGLANSTSSILLQTSVQAFRDDTSSVFCCSHDATANPPNNPPDALLSRSCCQYCVMDMGEKDWQITRAVAVVSSRP
ncbi:hypothetical protein V8C34DRAFT_282026 [Trichoderma compactum]